MFIIPVACINCGFIIGRESIYGEYIKRIVEYSVEGNISHEIKLKILHDLGVFKSCCIKDIISQPSPFT
jgi:DNA-directed RNA polymerase subunit N (RpoN/RPB10)